MKRIPLVLFSLALAAMPAAAQTNDASAPPAPVTATAPDPAPAPSPMMAPQQQQGSPMAMPGMGAPQQQPQEDITDIRPPVFFLHSWFWFWVAAAAIATVALLTGLWFWFRKNRQLSAKSAYELTLEKLEKARGLLREDNPMPYAVFVSETIRSYLGQRFQTPSTRRTTEEFLKQMEASEGTPLAQFRELLREFLQSCDMVKFGRYQPTLGELEHVQERAQNFVAATKPVTEVKA